MLNTELITSDLPPLALPEELGDVMGVAIYLYRAATFRPPHSMDPTTDAWLEPDQRPYPGFEMDSYLAPSGLRFTFYVDRITLKGLEPLWFQIVAKALRLNPFRSITILQMGGGGRGPQDDARLLQVMLDSLRTFPRDWHYIVEDGNGEMPTVGTFGESSGEALPASAQ